MGDTALALVPAHLALLFMALVRARSAPSRRPDQRRTRRLDLVSRARCSVRRLDRLPTETRDLADANLPGWFEILVIAISMAAILFATAYALAWTMPGASCCSSVFVAARGHAIRDRAADLARPRHAPHTQVLTLSAFAGGVLLPPHPGGSDANMSDRDQVSSSPRRPWALNIVVGLAGLLDLGYIAFPGRGGLFGAMFSTSAFATIGWKPPFFVVILRGRLRLRHARPHHRHADAACSPVTTWPSSRWLRRDLPPVDVNLDGNNGPNLTHGPNGIPAIPDLTIGSFNFGDTHLLLGIPLARFSNYYFLLLLLIGFHHPGVLPPQQQPNRPRLGGHPRGREGRRGHGSERLRAQGARFRVGAFLAGMAGTIKAHHDVSVTPDQYIFLESAFLLAAIVLGGMGTITGV
jgi:branched-chain amino acid transport system permease protein